MTIIHETAFVSPMGAPEIGWKQRCHAGNAGIVNASKYARFASLENIPLRLYRDVLDNPKGEGVLACREAVKG